MSLQTLEGHAVEINDVADHTFVYCPDNKRYFDCWGGHSGPDPRTICSGKGRYAVADCYRGPVILGHHDTAKIGVYAVNGVCHQSANCFLYSTNPTATLTTKVRGYWLTVTAYGAYGTLFLPWLAATYAPCRSAHSLAAERPDPSSLAGRLLALHEGVARTAAPAPEQVRERIIQEGVLVATDAIPGLDLAPVASSHGDFLREKDALIAARLTGVALAERLNAASAVFQRAAASALGADTYERLTGAPAGRTIAIIDPSLAQLAGVAG